MYANFIHRQDATNYNVQGLDQIFARGKSIALQCENYDKSCFYFVIQIPLFTDLQYVQERSMVPRLRRQFTSSAE